MSWKKHVSNSKHTETEMALQKSMLLVKAVTVLNNSSEGNLPATKKSTSVVWFTEIDRLYVFQPKQKWTRSIGVFWALLSVLRYFPLFFSSFFPTAFGVNTNTGLLLLFYRGTIQSMITFGRTSFFRNLSVQFTTIAHHKHSLSRTIVRDAQRYAPMLRPSLRISTASLR